MSNRIRRNDPCPCGSGRKYKRCCIGKIDYTQPDSFKVETRQKNSGSNSLPNSTILNKVINLSPEEEKIIRYLLSQDRKIHAIKRVKDITGADLKASKDYVESFAPFEKNNFSLEESQKWESLFIVEEINLSPEEEQEIRIFIGKGNKIEAIKRVVELTGAGLRVSKNYVESLM